RNSPLLNRLDDWNFHRCARGRWPRNFPLIRFRRNGDRDEARRTLTAGTAERAEHIAGDGTSARAMVAGRPPGYGSRLRKWILVGLACNDQQPVLNPRSPFV